MFVPTSAVSQQTGGTQPHGTDPVRMLMASAGMLTTDDYGVAEVPG